MSEQAASAEEGIAITGALKRERGQWYLHITGPKWALDDVRHSLEQGQSFAHAAYNQADPADRAGHLNFVLAPRQVSKPPASGS